MALICGRANFMLVAAAFLMPLSCLSQSSSQTFSLEGYAVDGITGQPIPGIRLHLFQAQDRTWYFVRIGRAAEPAISGPDGHFRFGGLAAHLYSLQAELPHEIVRYGDMQDYADLNASKNDLFAVGPRVEVGPKSEGRTVVFRISSGAVLTGAVHDEFGEPVERIAVSIYRWERKGARTGLVLQARSPTDDKGEYSFEGLSPAEYVVCTGSGDTHSPTAKSLVPYRPGNHSRIYTRACAPGLESSAARVQIEAGSRPRLDLELKSGPSFPLQVTGLVWPDSGSLSKQFPAYALFDNDTIGERVQGRRTVNLPGNGIEIPNVATGSYVVEARIIDVTGPGSIARREIQVTNEPPPLARLHPVPGASVEVRVRDEQGKPLDAGTATVSFIPSSPGLGIRRLGNVPVIALDPGTYWLSTQVLRPYCAASARLNAGEDILRRQIVVAPGTSATLEIRLTSQCGTVGLRTVSGGEALPFANFLVLLNGTPQNPGDAITGSSGPTGEASIGYVTPGRYLVWAWSSNGDGYVGPELVDAANQSGEVTVTAGQSASVSVDAMKRVGSLR